MGTATKILIGCGVAVTLFVVSCIFFLMSVKNTCVAQERGIEAQYEQNQNNLANYANKIMELVQVPKMAAAQIRDVAVAAIQGRYGEQGSKALFHAVQEQNPNVDASLYRTLMQATEAGRNSFAADQTTMIDKCRVYDTYAESFPQSLAVGMFGYPRYDRSKCKPVITDDTAKAFEMKRAGPLNLTSTAP